MGRGCELHTWWKAVCDEHKEFCDVVVDGPDRTKLLLGDREDLIGGFLRCHHACHLRLIHTGEDLDRLHNEGYRNVLRDHTGGDGRSER